MPAALEFIEPDLFFRYENRSEHHAFTRFQIALWYYQDANMTKPLYLHGATSFDEIRMLSGIPCIDTIFVDTRDSEYFDHSLNHLFAAAGDEAQLEKIFDA